MKSVTVASPLTVDQAGRRFRWAVLNSAAVLIGVTAVLVAGINTEFARHFGDISAWAAGLFALLACWWGARRAGKDRRTWSLLTLAVAVWWAGQTVWTIQNFGDGTDIELSLAAVGFVGYAIPAIAALLSFQRTSMRMVSRLRGVIDGLVITTATLFISWILVLGPAMNIGGFGPLLTVVGLVAPLVDATVAGLVLFLAMRQRTGARLPWVLLGSGLVTLTVTDTSYLSLAISGRLIDLGTLVVVGYVAALLLVGLAALAPSRTDVPAPVQYLTPGQELVPYIPFGIALLCSAGVDVLGDPFLTWDGIAVVVLVAVRQVMIIAEKQSLARDLENRVNARTAELRNAQEDLQQTFDNAPIGMVWTTLPGTIVQVNTVFCAMVGRTEDELVGMSVADITYPADLEASLLVIAQAAETPDFRFPRLEKRYRHKNGSDVWAEASLFVTKDVTGAPKYLVAQVQDITAKRAAARTQANQATFLEAVLENLDSGVVACDADGKLTIVNRALREMYGPISLQSEPAIWANHSGLLHPGGVIPMAQHEVPLVRALNGDHVHNAEFVVAIENGPQHVLLASGHAIHDAEGELLGAVIALHDITERREAEAALSRQALHDPLTDLANRALLKDRLEHAIARQSRQPEPLALLLLDLDGFKLVNDSLGHEAGDEVLITLAGRLRQCLRPDDTIARLGGDEFAVVLENTSEAQATAIADQILAEVRKPLAIQGRSVTSDASIGIMISTAIDSPESLLRNADLAMYAAKDLGKGNVQVFKASMHETVLERLTLDAELREAIANRQFALAYQPIVSLTTGHLQGFEALVRWTHPIRGMIPPASFIPLAEATGLIVPLGTWVLRTATQQAAKWRRTIPGADALTMSVNLSVRQLQDPAVVDIVASALSESGLPPELLQLEITESVFEHRGQIILAMLDALHASGVRLVVDDFGTGYSSLSRLHSLPIDKVKIDKSFVDLLGGGGAAPMVAATIAMAHSLGLEAVAEGVESADQIPFLLLHKCDDAQGYLFGRPISAMEMETVLQERLPAAPWGLDAAPQEALELPQP